MRSCSPVQPSVGFAWQGLESACGFCPCCLCLSQFAHCLHWEPVLANGCHSSHSASQMSWGRTQQCFHHPPLPPPSKGQMTPLPFHPFWAFELLHRRVWSQCVAGACYALGKIKTISCSVLGPWRGWLWVGVPRAGSAIPSQTHSTGSSPAPGGVPECPVPPSSGRVLRDAVGALTPMQGGVNQQGPHSRAG